MFKLSVTFFIPVIAIVVLQGCTTVAPTVELARISSPSDVKGDEIDTFYLRKSLIKIDKEGTTKDAEGVEIDNLSITSLIAEYTEFKVGVRRSDAIGVKTNLNITKTENTELIKEAGVEVDDKRVDMIGKAGAIIANLVPVVFDATKGLEPGSLPKIVNVNVILKANNVSRDAQEGLDAGDGVTLSFGEVPPDAKPIDEFTKPTIMSGLIYSACRAATVKFTYQKKVYKKMLKINDPRYFQSIAFPQKGKITFHTECGVSVSSEKDTGISSGTDIVDALATQGKAIKDAIDAAKKQDK